MCFSPLHILHEQTTYYSSLSWSFLNSLDFLSHRSLIVNWLWSTCTFLSFQFLTFFVFFSEYLICRRQYSALTSSLFFSLYYGWALFRRFFFVCWSMAWRTSRLWPWWQQQLSVSSHSHNGNTSLCKSSIALVSKTVGHDAIAQKVVGKV